MEKITKQLCENLETRTVLVPIYIKGSDKKRIDEICGELDVKINRIVYEFFKFGFDTYVDENTCSTKQNSDDEK